jgi:hypothetical protein
MADAVDEIYDESGRLCVSALMLSFVCRRTGTGTSRSRITGNTAPSSLEVDVSGIAQPMVAIIMDGYVVAVAGRSGSNSQNVSFACSAPVGVGFTYYIFDWTTALPASNGLRQMWNEAGQKTFDSNFWPMKIVAGLSGGSGDQLSAVPGIKFAAACSALGGHSIPGEAACYDSGNPNFDDLTTCNNIQARIDGKLYGGRTDSGGSRVTAGQVSYDDVLGSYGNYSSYQQNGGGWEIANLILVVDVTSIPVGVTFF